MAKTKVTKRRPAPPPAREASFRLRMSEEFRAYIDDVAAHLRVPTSVAVELAFVELAKAAKLDPPPRR